MELCKVVKMFPILGHVNLFMKQSPLLKIILSLLAPKIRRGARWAKICAVLG